MWDDVSVHEFYGQPSVAVLKKAREVAVTEGSLEDWPTIWATESAVPTFRLPVHSLEIHPATLSEIKICASLP